MEVFAGERSTFGVDISLELGAEFKAGAVFAEGIATARLTAGVNWEWETSSSTTRVDGSFRQFDTTQTVEISRTREVEVPPHSAVRAKDIVRSLDGIITPWTQIIAISARSRSTGQPLTGYEIMSQLRFNLFGGHLIRRADWFVIQSIRGAIQAPEFFKSEAFVEDVPSACN